MLDIEFLKPSIREIRKSILDIDDSYNNDWDILAELLQNSVDAIRKLKPKVGLIDIEVDCLQKTIRVKDNGTGIDPDKLAGLLAPFSTDKDEESDSIGEKGVGLTFVLFSANKFTILSGNDKGSKTGYIEGALNWKTSTSSDNLKIRLSEPSTKIFGTDIKLEKVGNIPIFKLSFNQLKFLLRTKTAIGNTNFIWNDDFKIEVRLKHTDLDGNLKEEPIPNSFWMIYDGLDKHSSINLDDFIDYAGDATKTDREKRMMLLNKVIFKSGEKKFNGRTIKYSTCFVPSRKAWDTLSVKNELCSEDELNDMDWLDEFEYVKFNSGIYTSVKGMPTGISIDHPTTGYAGYWSNIFIIFEDPQLKFDIGRKSIHGMTSRKFKNFAREIFNDYLKYVTKYVSGEIVIDTEWDKEEIFAEIGKLIELKSLKTTFKKTPKDQEASVAGIFYECIGNGTIKGLTPLSSGYRNRYDLYAKWGNKNLVIEFKSKLKNILKDFSDEQKLFDEINMIVCWDVSEADAQALADKGISLEEIQSSVLSINDKKEIPHSTHKLVLSGITNPVYVMDLKKIVS